MERLSPVGMWRVLLNGIWQTTSLMRLWRLWRLVCFSSTLNILLIQKHCWPGRSDPWKPTIGSVAQFCQWSTWRPKRRIALKENYEMLIMLIPAWCSDNDILFITYILFTALSCYIVQHGRYMYVVYTCLMQMIRNHLSI